MTENTIIEAKDIYKHYIQVQTRVDVLDGVNLSIKRRSLVGIIGASGSGKSTLMHLLGLLDSPSNGSIYFNGDDISKFSSSKINKLRNKFLGFVFQNHYLLSDFNAIDNVIMPKMINGSNYNDSFNEAKELMDRLGLIKRTYSYPGELSGGEQQRIAIARAIINKPNVILADEPTGNLDFETAANVFDMFMDLIKDYGTTVIIVTHNLDLAKKMDIVYKLEHGSLKIYDY